MVVKVALYKSIDRKDEEFWSIPEVAILYNLSITDTGKYDYGGEHIYSICGSEKDLDKFAKEFCSADSITDLAPSVES